MKNMAKKSANKFQTLLDELTDWEGDEEEDVELLIEAVEMDKGTQAVLIQHTIGTEETAFIDICGTRPTTSSTAATSSSSSTTMPPTWRRKLGTGIWFEKKDTKIFM